MLAVQLEGGDQVLELGPKQLGKYAHALGRAWREIGVGKGDRVMIYDYGASPATYLASKRFAPYLERGAAEITGSQVICIDGLTSNAERAAHVVRYFKPSFIFARLDVVPLLVSGPTALPGKGEGLTLIVIATERPAQVDINAWSGAWAGAIRLLLHNGGELGFEVV